MRQLVNLALFALFICGFCLFVTFCIGCAPQTGPTQPVTTATITVPTAVHPLTDTATTPSPVPDTLACIWRGYPPGQSPDGQASACAAALDRHTFRIDTLRSSSYFAVVPAPPAWTCTPTTGSFNDTLDVSFEGSDTAGTFVLDSLHCAMYPDSGSSRLDIVDATPVPLAASWDLDGYWLGPAVLWHGGSVSLVLIPPDGGYPPNVAASLRLPDGTLVYATWAVDSAVVASSVTQDRRSAASQPMARNRAETGQGGTQGVKTHSASQRPLGSILGHLTRTQP